VKPAIAILISTCTLALGAAGWLFYQNDQLTEKNSALENTINLLEQEFQDLSDALSESKGNSQETLQALEASRVEQNRLLENHAKEIESIKASTAQEKDEISNLHEALIQELQSEITNREIQLKERNGRISLSMENKILFLSGQSALGERGRTVLDKVSDALNKNTDHVIRVEGHTDNMPLSGKGLYKSNWDLSAARALSVVQQLLQGHDLDPKLIEAVAKGEFHPIGDNNTSLGRAQNRRIEIYLSPALK
jgi:chemotaxis protein MotB